MDVGEGGGGGMKLYKVDTVREMKMIVMVIEMVLLIKPEKARERKSYIQTTETSQMAHFLIRSIVL